jgi:hypothetical protein
MSMSQDHLVEMQRVMRRWIEAVEASSVEHFVAVLEAWAQTLFTDAKLPPWDSIVRLYPDGQWAQDLPPDWDTRVQELLRPGEEICSAGMLIERLYGRASQEWFACMVLLYVDWLRRAQTAQDMDAGMRALHRLERLEVLLRYKVEWEPDVLFVRRMREGFRRGGKLHAQDPERFQRYATWQALADQCWAKNPEKRKRSVARFISQQIGDPLDTIRKHILSPQDRLRLAHKKLTTS